MNSLQLTWFWSPSIYLVVHGSNIMKNSTNHLATKIKFTEVRVFYTRKSSFYLFSGFRKAHFVEAVTALLVFAYLSLVVIWKPRKWQMKKNGTWKNYSPSILSTEHDTSSARFNKRYSSLRAIVSINRLFRALTCLRTICLANDVLDTKCATNTEVAAPESLYCPKTIGKKALLQLCVALDACAAAIWLVTNQGSHSVNKQWTVWQVP